MRIVLNHDAADAATLDAAWNTNDTFVLLPKCGAAEQDRADALMARLPDAFRQHHFALLTSGSTGRPKLVIASRQRAERLAEVLHQQQKSEDVEETIVVLPLSYSYALINQWVWSRHLQRRLTLTPGFGQPDAVEAALERARRAMLCLVGIQVPLLARYFGGRRFPGILRLHFAGGRFPQEKLAFLHEMFPNAKIFNNYGCTEALPRLTLREAEAADDATDIGHPLIGVELMSGTEQALLFRSPYGALATVDDADVHLITPDAWVPTGDMGEQTASGSWRLLGRDVDVFKRYGEKVSLLMLTAAVLRKWHGDAVFYRERDVAGEDCHVLMLSPAADDASVRAVLSCFRAAGSRAQWPLRVESMAVLPTLQNGKFDTQAVAQSEEKTVHWRQRL